jgi:type VI secretion system protein ImpF
MAKIATDQPLVPSLLDRLLDDEPEVKREPSKMRQQVLRELKQSVRRDLENLLNTRRRARPRPPELEELERSLVNYGLPDFVGGSLASDDDREAFRQTVEKVIRTFEPRFKAVQVHLVDAAEPLNRTLRFRIDALLYAYPAPEVVVFDSAVEPVTGNFEVKGGG